MLIQQEMKGLLNENWSYNSEINLMYSKYIKKNKPLLFNLIGTNNCDWFFNIIAELQAIYFPDFFCALCKNYVASSFKTSNRQETCIG